MISQTAEYCLRAVVCLASAPEKPQTTQQIAAATKIPAGYLSKVLQSLNRADIVSAQRGLNGGFLLHRSPDALSLLEVVRVADPSHRITTCPLGIHGTNLCALHRELDNAAALAENALARMTVTELVAARGVPPMIAATTESASAFPCTMEGCASCSK
jgi:Rrf2 family transcriptional regulator, nitric oxide-sensitive transcriptional repressor